MDAYRCAICNSMMESGPGNDFELFFNQRGHVCWYCIGRAIRMLYLHVKGSVSAQDEHFLGHGTRSGIEDACVYT